MKLIIEATIDDSLDMAAIMEWATALREMVREYAELTRYVLDDVPAQLNLDA